MSLLLEALKKAELAKQGTQAEPEAPAAAPEETPFPRVELTIEEPEEPRPSVVITRESLPDISQPLEISSEELSPQRARVEPRMEAPPPRAPEPRPAPAAASAPPEPDRVPEPVRPAVETASVQRDAARQMFDVKEVDYNPRRPFYLTIGGLIAAGACYGGYVWWQMQPRYSVNAAAVQNAPKGAPPPVAAPAPVAAAADPASAPVAQSAAAPVPQPAPAQQRRGAAAPESDAGTEKPTPATPMFLATQRAAASPKPAPAAASRAQRSEPAPIAITPPSLQTDPALDRAYRSYQAGNLDSAREDYSRVLERDSTNRDALLGLAAIDMRTRSYETAELRYIRLLEMNPRDTHAHAALISMQGGLDPVQSESRLKILIAGQPDASHLYFTLGNLYASQSRWAEAQDAYFKAFSAELENADYAFNLAVSLDQLRQRRLAAEYYRRAISLATSRPAAFDRAQAEQRARELER
jgi:tetratricopeptide (TPR) repeat protein